MKNFLTCKDYKVLWHEGYWDGALSGYLQTHDGEFLHFDCVVDEHEESQWDDDDNVIDWHSYRVYAIYKPTKEQEELAKINHLYTLSIGYWHVDWDYRFKKNDIEKPKVECPKDYKKTDFPKYETSQIVGYTTMNHLYKSADLNGQR